MASQPLLLLPPSTPGVMRGCIEQKTAIASVDPFGQRLSRLQGGTCAAAVLCGATRLQQSFDASLVYNRSFCVSTAGFDDLMISCSSSWKSHSFGVLQSFCITSLSEVYVSLCAFLCSAFLGFLSLAFFAFLKFSDTFLHCYLPFSASACLQLVIPCIVFSKEVSVLHGL